MGGRAACRRRPWCSRWSRLEPDATSARHTMQSWSTLWRRRQAVTWTDGRSWARRLRAVRHHAAAVSLPEAFEGDGLAAAAATAVAVFDSRSTTNTYTFWSGRSPRCSVCSYLRTVRARWCTLLTARPSTSAPSLLMRPLEDPAQIVCCCSVSRFLLPVHAAAALSRRPGGSPAQRFGARSS